VYGILSDFWWLDSDQFNIFNYLILGHSDPVDDLTGPNIIPQKCQITALDAYRITYQNTNIYRSLKLSDRPLNGQEIVGPFLIDIDNENNLEASQSITKQTLEYLINQYNLSSENYLRIFFTGHKGFNIEILPKVLTIRYLNDDLVTIYRKNRRNITTYLRTKNNITNNILNYVDNEGTIIDTIHDYVRLHNSINKWIDSNGNELSRKKIELTYQDLISKSITDITFESESQV
jgi:hypothetical protein